MSSPSSGRVIVARCCRRSISWSHADASANADAILRAVATGAMPCDTAWPPDQVDVVRRWVAAGRNWPKSPQPRPGRVVPVVATYRVWRLYRSPTGPPTVRVHVGETRRSPLPRSQERPGSRSSAPAGTRPTSRSGPCPHGMAIDARRRDRAVTGGARHPLARLEPPLAHVSGEPAPHRGLARATALLDLRIRPHDLQHGVRHPRRHGDDHGRIRESESPLEARDRRLEHGAGALGRASHARRTRREHRRAPPPEGMGSPR